MNGGKQNSKRKSCGYENIPKRVNRYSSNTVEIKLGKRYLVKILYLTPSWPSAWVQSNLFILFGLFFS